MRLRPGKGFNLISSYLTFENTTPWDVSPSRRTSADRGDVELQEVTKGAGNEHELLDSSTDPTPTPPSTSLHRPLPPPAHQTPPTVA